jgi:hypothetical protein
MYSYLNVFTFKTKWYVPCVILVLNTCSIEYHNVNSIKWILEKIGSWCYGKVMEVSYDGTSIVIDVCRLWNYWVDNLVMKI